MLTIEDWLPYFINEDVKAHFFPIQGLDSGTINSISARYINTVVEYLQGIEPHPYVDSILSIIKNKGRYSKFLHRQFVYKTRNLDKSRKRDVNKLSPRIKSYMEEIG